MGVLAGGPLVVGWGFQPGDMLTRWVNFGGLMYSLGIETCETCDRPASLPLPHRVWGGRTSQLMARTCW